MKVLTVIFIWCFLIGCESSSKKSAWGEEQDPTRQPMRHGWVVFSGPKRTIIGVNNPKSIANGKALFAQHCQKCHGPNGKGDGEYAKELGLKPANLAATSKNMPNHYLVMQINNGKGSMPRWNDLLTAQQSWDLTNYIQTLNKK